MSNKALLTALSEILGWILVATWSFVPLPQFFLNRQRQSVTHFSQEFQYLNMVGFFYYSIYCFYGYFYQRSHNMTQSIVYQDLIWCGITTIIVYMIAVQFWLYRKTITREMNVFYRTSLMFLVGLGVYNTLLASLGYLDWFSHDEGYSSFSWAHYLGYSKMYVSLIKYIPQLLIHVKNQHTLGFSIVQVMLDIFGATAGLLQMFLRAHIDTKADGSPNYDNVFGNIPKLLLQCESIVFTLMFLVQHFVIYRKNNLIMLQRLEATGGVWDGEGGFASSGEDGGDVEEGINDESLYPVQDDESVLLFASAGEPSVNNKNNQQYDETTPIVVHSQPSSRRGSVVDQQT